MFICQILWVTASFMAIARAKAVSCEVISRYYQELGTVITSNNLSDKPGWMYNIYETGISTTHYSQDSLWWRHQTTVSYIPQRAFTLSAAEIPPCYMLLGVKWSGSLLELQVECLKVDGLHQKSSKSVWLSTLHCKQTSNLDQILNLL